MSGNVSRQIGIVIDEPLRQFLWGKTLPGVGEVVTVPGTVQIPVGFKPKSTTKSPQSNLVVGNRQRQLGAGGVKDQRKCGPTSDVRVVDGEAYNVNHRARNLGHRDYVR